jgi:predicted  nucleic acid-binding Zn-ribbon protein
MDTMSGLDGLGWPNPEDEPKPKTMNDTPTPETDSAYIQCPNEGAWDFRIRQEKIMAKLERERDEARERADTMFAKHANIIDEARNKRDEAREQRDRLAEAVNAATVLIAAKGRHNTMLAYEGLRKALATTNQPIYERHTRNRCYYPPIHCDLRHDW